ncbi:MAG: T9SS type A sorting domain-containing protein, partial [Ekhidna sp.]|nr:T9SS type A sorting domain-containing protein [Ekhidna sp.]
GNTSTQTQEVICPLGAADEEAAVIFPNPSDRYLEVRSPIRGTFQLLSLSGKPLLKGTTNTQMDIASLQSGLYLVQLPDGRLLKFVRE